MGLEVVNLSKNTALNLNKKVSSVFLNTNENLYSGNPIYNDWKNGGYIEEGTIKYNAVPSTKKNSDGQTFTKGYDCSFEFISEQYYSLFQFEKFANKLCTINLEGISTYIKNIVLNVELIGELNDKNEARVKISGTKYVEKFRDFVDGNPWGDMPAPWASNTPTPSGAAKHPGMQPTTEDFPNAYDYVLLLNNEKVQFVTPAIPTAEDDIEEFKLIFVDLDHNPVVQEPKQVEAYILAGVEETEIDSEAYEVIFEEGVYKLHYDSETTTLNLKDVIRVKWDYSEAEE